MQLRLLVLAGWNKTKDGFIPVNLYFGTDGVKLQEAADNAAKTGNFVAIRKFINPSGTPCPVVIDVQPAKPEPAKAQTKPVTVQQKPNPAQDALKKERDEAEAKRLAALEKDKTDTEAAKQGRLFSELNMKTKAELGEILNDLNSDLPEADRKKPISGSKVELINTILLLQATKK
jgi:hypothetical protein